jgi:hypothetical protein
VVVSRDINVCVGVVGIGCYLLTFTTFLNVIDPSKKKIRTHSKLFI